MAFFTSKRDGSGERSKTRGKGEEVALCVEGLLRLAMVSSNEAWPRERVTWDMLEVRGGGDETARRDGRLRWGLARRFVLCCLDRISEERDVQKGVC